MKKKLLSLALTAVLMTVTIFASALPASAVEGAVSQHYDGEIKGEGQVIEYKFGIGIAGDFEFSVSGDLQKYGISFSDAMGNTYVNESCHNGSFNEKLYISAGTYSIKISAFEKVTGKYSLDFTFTPFYESFPEDEGGSNNTLQTANKADTETIYKGLLTENDTVDIFKYQFDKRAMLAIDASSHMDSVNVYLLTESGEVISSSTIKKDKKHTFVIPVAKGGTYYVAFVSDNCTGSYELDTTKAVCGDFDNDGKIDVNDVTVLQMFISGDYKFSDLKVLSADLNGDGLVMITDVTYLQVCVADGTESV